MITAIVLLGEILLNLLQMEGIHLMSYGKPSIRV